MAVELYFELMRADSSLGEAPDIFMSVFSYRVSFSRSLSSMTRWIRPLRAGT